MRSNLPARLTNSVVREALIQLGIALPRQLKPLIFQGFYGTAKAVPFKRPLNQRFLNVGLLLSGRRSDNAVIIMLIVTAPLVDHKFTVSAC